MTNNYISGNCLTYEQLQSYTLHKVKNDEISTIYKHLSGCELCSAAVNGFSELPFTKEFVELLDKEIDLKSNASKQLSLISFAQLAIVAVLLVSAVAFFKVANYNQDKGISSRVTKEFPLDIAIVYETKVKEPIAKTSLSETKERKLHHVKEKSISIDTKTNTVLESMKSIAPALNDSFNLIAPSIKLQDDANTNDVIYIEDMKVVNYNKLYFNHTSLSSDFKGYVPPSIENEKVNNSQLLMDDEQKYLAKDILRKGLHYFNQQNYLAAIDQFQLLLNNNKEDLNALFYSALCYSEIGKYRLAIKVFKELLSTGNSCFYEETKWKLALTYKKAGDKENATQLLKEIIKENGFYAEKAKRLLN